MIQTQKPLQLSDAECTAGISLLARGHEVKDAGHAWNRLQIWAWRPNNDVLPSSDACLQRNV